MNSGTATIQSTNVQGGVGLNIGKLGNLWESLTCEGGINVWELLMCENNMWEKHVRKTCAKNMLEKCVLNPCVENMWAKCVRKLCGENM